MCAAYEHYCTGFLQSQTLLHTLNESEKFTEVTSCRSGHSTPISSFLTLPLRHLYNLTQILAKQNKSLQTIAEGKLRVNAFCYCWSCNLEIYQIYFSKAQNSI